MREMVICERKLREFRHTSPRMRKEHLQRRLQHHILHKNKDKVYAIAKILSAESTQKMWEGPRQVWAKKKSAPLHRVTTTDEEGNTVVYSEKEDVERAVGEHLVDRFKTPRHKRCGFESQLKGDFGHKAETAAADDVFTGRYIPPEGTDAATVQYLKECKEVWNEHRRTVDILFTRGDFTSWWKTAREKTESSPSGVHFGHYKAQSHNDHLADIQVQKLNIAYRRGLPLERWLHGTTVLLAKKAGGVTIDKMRAICLFEADFNWAQKIIFARNMMANAREHDLLPPELHARSGTSAPAGCLTRILWCDINRTMNRSFSVQNCDLGQCYDAIHHVAASLALRAFGVPKRAVGLMHTVLQEMKFWLRSSFGDCDTPFGGSALLWVKIVSAKSTHSSQYIRPPTHKLKLNISLFRPPARPPAPLNKPSNPRSLSSAVPCQ